MKRIKKGLALSRETIRPLADTTLRDVRGAMIASVSICNPCPSVAQTNCTSCPSYGPHSYCCLSSEATACFK